MQWIRAYDPSDKSRVNATGTTTQTLADLTSGIESSRWNISRVPPGGQAGPGTHVHVFDQFYYVISGTMTLEMGMAREIVKAGPNSLVVIPAGVPHRNWNEGPEDEVHLNVGVPHPDPAIAADLPVRFDIY